MDGKTGFYEKQCEFNAVDKTEDDFLGNCPKLSQDAHHLMEADLTCAELLSALRSCTDSAPGPDGIPYSVYKRLWEIPGPIILSAWEFSCTTGNLPALHTESVISLILKEGKDARDIKQGS